MSVKGYGEAECSVCGMYHCEAFYCKECLDEEVKQVSAEAVRGVLDYVESMFPELESTYWQGKNWKRFRKEWRL